MDFALIKAHKADNLGNCTYRYAAMNNNPEIATASEFTICEAEEIVKPGELDPEKVGT
jgi:acyl CoA:acetate/3-ketoacid CoA transferase alpha subunit